MPGCWRKLADMLTSPGKMALTSAASGCCSRRSKSRRTGVPEEGRLAQRDYLRKAASAEPDPGWLCTHCRTPLLRWLPVCPACGTAGTVRWVAAETQPVLESSEVVA